MQRNTRYVWAKREERRENGETHRISSALEISDVDHRCIGVGLLCLAAGHVGGARRICSKSGMWGMAFAPYCAIEWGEVLGPV